MTQHWYRRKRIRKDGQPYLENRWHTFLMTAYSDAAVLWWDECNAVTYENHGDICEHKRDHPMPQLKDYMIRLGKEWRHGQEEESGDPVRAA